MTDTATPQEYAVLIPSHLADDLEAAAAFLRMRAHDDGWFVTGEPYIHRSEPMNIGTPDEPCYPFGDAPYLTVRAEAEKVPPRPLPVFVPSTATVETAAQKVAHSFDPTLVWDDAPAHVKNFYARLARDVIVAAGQHLVADALEHLADNDAAYNVDASVGHRAAASEVRRRLKGES